MPIRNDNVTLNLTEGGDPAAAPLLSMAGSLLTVDAADLDPVKPDAVVDPEIAARPTLRSAVVEFPDRVAT